ncbi:MAG TPA: FliH/SctL family protein [Gaiellaceae bacterium]|jgi:flagellar biosynthesis/type III secretory pathway protein FliH
MADVAFDFPTLEPTGELVLADGASPNSRAAEIVAKAESQAASIAAEAAAHGQQQGYAAGLAAAEAQLAPVREALAAVVDGVAAAEERFVAAAELRSVELAIALAEKIVGAALELRPELVVEIVTGALRRSVDRDRLVVEVNPDDVELVRHSVTESADRLGVGRLEVVAERRVARGGCVVRTSEGEIDARISEQLERAGELLRDTFASRRADD